jgi:hypothetical protein
LKMPNARYVLIFAKEMCARVIFLVQDVADFQN